MADFLLRMPKSELHLHLEGSVEPETLYELDPSTPLEDLRALYTYENFDAFLKAFGQVGKRLRGPDDYGLITRRLLERLAAQNVAYAEIIVAAGVVLWKEQDFAPIFDAIAAAAEGSPVRVRWILDAVRQFGVEQARTVAEWAAARQDRGVVAIGIGGSEERGPAEWFTEVFAFAKREGLHLLAHAGEGTSPQSVWAALRAIPPGTTTTYGRLAASLGRKGASRAVGAANGANPIPIVVPCHRVIGADGSLTGFGSGLPRKKWLLNHERIHADAATKVIIA